MKRRTALALACILALSLTACGGKKAAKESAETTEMTETAESGAGTEKQVKAEFRITPFQAVDKEDYGVKVVNYGTSARIRNTCNSHFRIRVRTRAMSLC